LPVSSANAITNDSTRDRIKLKNIVAERIRKLGDVALRSIGDIAQHQRVDDNDAPSLTPEAMLTDLLANNQELIKYLRATHDVCDQYKDVATGSLIENWIDETENRAWFLYEILHRA
jgi:starvation-inducible DNA-binding protein